MVGFRPSLQQRRLWLLEQTHGPQFSHSVTRVHGDIAGSAIREAIDRITADFEILRTQLQACAEVRFPIQVIAPKAALYWEEIDARVMAADSGSSGVARWLLQASSAGTARPAVQAALFHLNEQEHLLILRLPATIADARTHWLITRRIARYLDGFTDCDEQSLQYADFSEWQHELVLSVGTRGERFGDYREPVVSTSQVPHARRRGLLRPYALSLLQPDLNPQCIVRARELALAHGVSFEAFLLACWQVLLAKIGAERELLIGYGWSGRHYEDLREALGPLSAVLPMKLSSAPERPFAQVMEHAQHALNTQFEYPEVFLSHVVQDGHPQRDGFSLGFDYVGGCTPQSGGGLRFEFEQCSLSVERYQLALCGLDAEQRLRLQIKYDGGAVDEAGVRCLASQFCSLLEAVVRGPDTPVEKLDVRGAGERQVLSHDLERAESAWRARRYAIEDPENPVCLHHWFERQVRQTPDAIAVTAGRMQLTYSELDIQANRLAHLLRRDYGVRPDALVGVLGDHTLQTLVAILGILKAGGAYLPLDPAQPPLRLRLILEAASPVVVLVAEPGGDDWDSLGIPVLRAGDEPAFSNLPATAPEVEMDACQLAYVIFTSGSTGEPKGVAVEHRQITNYVRGILERMRPAPGTVFATLATFASDLGYTAIFASLCSGGALRLISSHESLGAVPASAEPIGILKIVPSHLRALLAGDAAKHLLPTCGLILGGETFPWDLADYLRASDKPNWILNHYGPTETTVGSLVYLLTDQSLPATQSVPIGRPLSNYRVYVLDEDLQIAPVGAVGQVFIGGAGVSRGYLNRPALTAERFIPDAWSPEPGARLYATGDLARYLPDSNIEFIGRADHQVKLRGYRIELGEIASALRMHPAVREAVAALRSLGGTERLVAYIVPKHSVSLTGPEMHEHLGRHIPGYMLPSSFVFLRELPLLRNGKVDLGQLPDPDTFNTTAEETYEPPRNAVEELLVSIWREVLAVDRIGIRDSFFELGGDSLQSIQVVSRINTQFQVQLLPRHLFETPTIADLGDLLVKNEPQPGIVAVIAQLRKELNAMSEDEVAHRLHAREAAKVSCGSD